MLELGSSEYRGLPAPHFPSHWFNDASGNWSASFVSPRDEEQIQWGFLLRNASGVSRGFENSIAQRSGLWNEAFPEVSIKVFPPGEEDSLFVATPAFDGEPLGRFFERVKPGVGAPLLSILLDTVRELSRLIVFPRLLSNIVWEDILVRRESGVNVSAGICPVFSILREETPQSDFSVGRYWTGVIAALTVAAGDRWSRDFSAYDPVSSRAFRPLLKSMDRGREISLRECFTELEGIILNELESVKIPREKWRTEWGKCAVPRGALAVSLAGAFGDSHPDMIASNSGREDPQVFSQFSVRIDGKQEGSREEAVLLPPECWFEGSLIDPVNRRMSTQFLKVHPNLARVRSILCDDGFTALKGEKGGVPLTSLLEAHGGLVAESVLRLGGKAARAFSQFESAEYDLRLESPWQLEIQAVDPAREDELLAGWMDERIEDWPAWDIKVRVERPAELFLPPGNAEKAWDQVFTRMKGKVFPALMVWMLEWKRLVWAAREGTLGSEPLSWDKEMNALFEAAIQHYECANQAHRTRFLELIEEGCPAI